MATIKYYNEDLQIAESLIAHNEKITREFYYQQCYPLFKSIYDNFYTDCKCVREFQDEIYLVLLAPSMKTGRCQMENFRGESTLTRWLKTACLYYCYAKFKEKQNMPSYEKILLTNVNDDDNSDRNEAIYGSNEIDFDNLNREDAETILNLMPNKRYSNIIRMLYLEHRTLTETAEALGMSMDNFYNKEILAKEQYKRVLRKEARHA